MHDRIIFFILVAVLFVSTGLWTYFDVIENGDEMEKLEKEYNVIENNFIMLSQIEEGYDEVKERHVSKIIEFDSLKTTIPDFDTYANVIEKIREIAEKQSITIESFHPKMEDSFPALKTKLNYTQKHIERRPIQLRIYGNYLTIGSFVEEILKIEKIVNVYTMNLETELNNSEILSCDIVLFAYIIFDELRKT